MNWIRAFVLSSAVLVVCVSAYPNDKAVSKDTGEYTTAYIASELQKTNLEPVKLMEYLAKLMGLSTFNIGSDSCVHGGELSFSDLQSIMRTVVTPNSSFTTLLTPDMGHTVYKELRAVDAYFRLQQAVRSNQFNPTDIWANYSPCKTCTKTLIELYEKSPSKPVFHYAQIYTEENDVISALESMQCLARLQHEGFTVRAWDWSYFKDKVLQTDKCISEVDSKLTQQSQEFNEKALETVIVGQFIMSLSGIEAAASWCS